LVAKPFATFDFDVAEKRAVVSSMFCFTATPLFC
jgi:hypothetical protein